MHSKLDDFKQIWSCPSQEIQTAGDPITINQQGTVIKKIKTQDGKYKIIALKNVFYVPNLKYSLLSSYQFEILGHHWTNKQIILTSGYEIPILHEDRKYLIELEETNLGLQAFHTSANNSDSLTLLHKRLGHADRQMIQRLPKHVEGMPDKLKEDLPIVCENCQLAKLHKAPIPKSPRTNFVNKRLQLIHMDTGGAGYPASLPYGHSKFVVFLDDFSGILCMYTVEETTSKELLRCFKRFLTLVQSYQTPSRNSMNESLKIVDFSLRL